MFTNNNNNNTISFHCFRSNVLQTIQHAYHCKKASCIKTTFSLLTQPLFRNNSTFKSIINWIIPLILNISQIVSNFRFIEFKFKLPILIIYKNNANNKKSINSKIVFGKFFFPPSPIMFKFILVFLCSCVNNIRQNMNKSPLGRLNVQHKTILFWLASYWNCCMLHYNNNSAIVY